MLLRNLNDLRELFDTLKGTFAGAGMTAFSRVTPTYFLNPYSVIALRKTCDIPLLRKKAHLFCLEDEIGESILARGYTSADLLGHSMARKFLCALPNPKYLLLYQNYPELESLARQEGWVLLANSAYLRIRVAKRAFFKKLVSNLNLPLIPGAVYPIEIIHMRRYKDWVESLGPKFVVQLPDIYQGGGKGTFFVHSPSQYKKLQGRLKGKTWRDVTLKSVSIHRFVDGTSVSMALCITRYGLLFSGLQRQLIDLPYCRSLYENGVFCGHAWGGSPWPSSVIEESGTQARLIGNSLAALGYRGIVGIDFLIDKRDQRVYPLEINPRFTGAFPMLSLLHIKNNLIPLEAFHILEFLDVHYNIDVEQLNASYQEPVKGSHLLLFLLLEGKKTVIKRLEAGLYESDPDMGKISFVRGALDYREIQNERQFIIMEGPPDTGGGALRTSDPHYRLCRLLFSQPVVNDAGVLARCALDAVEWVHRNIVREVP